MSLHSLCYTGLIYNQPINQLEALRIGTHSIPSDVRENMYLLLLLIFIPLCELVVGSDLCLD